MSDRDINLLILDIEAAINSILEYTKGYDSVHYLNDPKTQHAVERNFEIIGEASARIPSFYKEQHPEVEWRILKDFRNFIIHDYFGINHRIVWETIQIKLPELLSLINQLRN